MHHPEALKRLRTIEGHIRGIQRMLEEDSYCIEVIKQIQAVQAALNRVNRLILDEHLNSCLTIAIQGEDPVAREKIINEITDVFNARSKI